MAYGFRPVRKTDGSAYNGALLYGDVTESNGAMARGDVLELNTDGTIDIAAASAVNYIGVAQYFEWTDANGVFNQSGYLAASTASSTIEVKVYYTPCEGIIYSAIADDVTTALAATDIGENVNFVVGTPNQKREISLSMIDSNTSNTTATLPFTLLGLVAKPGNAFGSADPTTAAVEVEVRFNAWVYRSLGSTGLA